MTRILRYLSPVPVWLAVTSVFALTACSDPARSVFAQETSKRDRAALNPDATQAERDRAARAAAMKQAAAEYTFYRDTQDRVPLKLHSEPVLRWSNPVRGTTDGAVFIWTANGRPEVAAGIYKWRSESDEPDMEHEISSLSVGRLTAERQDRTVWNPATPGIELKTFADAPPPADALPARLRQMRSLAGEFRAFHNRPNKPEELRLLPQPLYRYENTESDLFDGAIFSFVQATDPEVLLLIEARRNADHYEWQYALARMTSVPLRAEHRDAKVWEVPDCWAQVSERRAPYTAFFKQRLGQ